MINNPYNNINNSSLFSNNLISPSLNHAKQFQKYQINISSNNKNMVHKKEFSYKENFKSMRGPTNVTQKAVNVLKNTKISSSEEDLVSQYNSLIAEYQSSLQKFNNQIQSYYNRTGPDNPYAGKNISISGNYFYVTQMGVAKYWSGTVWGSISSDPDSFPNCPKTSEMITVDVPWSETYFTPGSIIPTNPTLIVGTPMVAGQSCGNEGKNIIVNKMIGNSTVNFLGNYADSSTSPLMTNINTADGTSENVLSFEGCREQAILSGNSLFALQNADSSTGFGLCNLSNNLAQATSLGKAQQLSPVILWSSNTASLGGVSASLTTSGTLAVYDASNNIVYQSPSPTITTAPANSIAATTST
jgi:hypothetical protein